jgi:predicted amidophosphoribosyltransferase
MKCPKCQFDNREGIKFCEECGAKMELKCPKCGALKERIRERIFRIHEIFEDKFELYRNLTQTDPKKAETLAEKLILTFGEDFWTIIVRKQPSRLS